MRRLEGSCAVRHIYIYMSLGAKGLIFYNEIIISVSSTIHEKGGNALREKRNRIFKVKPGDT